MLIKTNKKLFLGTSWSSVKTQNTLWDLCVKLLKLLSLPESLLSLNPLPSAQGACLEMVALSSSVKTRFCCLLSPGKQRAGTEEDSSKLGPCLQLYGEENRQT